MATGSQGYLSRAQKLQAEGAYAWAAEEYALVLDLEPTNQAAREGSALCLTKSADKKHPASGGPESAAKLVEALNAVGIPGLRWERNQAAVFTRLTTAQANNVNSIARQSQGSQAAAARFRKLARWEGGDLKLEWAEDPTNRNKRIWLIANLGAIVADPQRFIESYTISAGATRSVLEGNFERALAQVAALPDK